MDATSGQPNRIQVVVRVRPVLPHEINDDVAVTCSHDSTKVQVTLPDRLAAQHALPGQGPAGVSRSAGARSYEFDACLTGSTTQEELYDCCGLSELVESALDGYCVTIFAFGQTGSGKTHSIIGPRLSRGTGGMKDDDALSVEPDDGLLTRCIDTAFRGIEARQALADYSVSASVVELYNENVTDLLALDKSKSMQVRKDARDGFQVSGLTQVACPTDTAAVRYLTRALQHRHTRSHKLNDYSSRSHCLMTFVFASKEQGPQGQQGSKGGVRRYGKLCLVDLAGSERLKDTGNTAKEAVRETGAINKSLFVLGQVLSALSSRSSGAPPFVPYRDSKLTQLLWDGLRGNGRCLMLACMGPMRGAVEESLNTLHFASMALRIKAEPVVLLDPQDQLVLELRKTITDLRQENRQLAAALQQLGTGADAAAVIALLPESIRRDAANSDQDDAESVGFQPLPAMSRQYGGDGGPGPGSVRTSQQLLHGAPPAPAHGLHPSNSAEALGSSAIPNLRSSYAAPPPPRSSPGPGPGSGGRAPPPPIHPRAPPYPNSYPYPSSNVSSPSSAHGNNGYRGSPASPGFSSPSRRRGSNGQRSRSVGSDVRQSQVSPSPGSGLAPRSVYNEDPAALLFGYSAALQQRAGGGDAGPSGNGLSPCVALPPLAPGSRRGQQAEAVAAAPAPLAMSQYPELAAMEAQFQSLMGGGGGAGVGPSSRAAASPSNRSSGSSERFSNSRGAGAGAGGAAAGRSGSSRGSVSATQPADGDGCDDPDLPKPDSSALKWADRNPWFGTDYDMTAYAYLVHDRLVDEQHIDPTSDFYYHEIERHIAEKFPDRWADLLRQQQQQAAAAARSNSRRAIGASPTRPRLSGSGDAQPAAGQQQQQHYGAGLRVNMRESVAAAMGLGGGGGFDPQPSYGNASAPSTPLVSSVNPFNIQAMHSAAPPKPSRFAPAAGAGAAAGGGGGLVLMPMGNGFGGAGGEPGGWGQQQQAAVGEGERQSVEQIQREYMRQRAAVVEELRRAKEDAEAERKRILAKINKTLGGGSWR